jgi:CRP/FNR family cyclic AMP-dependent transcriptional regulator
MDEAFVTFSRVTGKKQISRGSTLFSEKQPLGDLYYLESGYAKLFGSDTDGRETLYSILNPGRIYGISLDHGNSHSMCSARMITDGAVRIIPREHLARFCEKDPRGWRWLAEREARERLSLERRIEILSLPDVTRRLTALIPYLIGECNFPREADGSYIIPMLQSELAGFVGATRETTSAMLNALAKRHLLIPRRGRVVIPDLQALIQS